VKIAASVLACDFGRLAEEIAAAAEGGAAWIHLDVMDGHFVPNISFGPFICRFVRRISQLPLDAHLMISHPEQYLDAFAKAGVDGLTIHVEVGTSVGACLRRIGELGLSRGLSLRPGTPLADVEPWLGEVDLVLVMSVEPGFGGQAFNPAAPARIAELKRQRTAGGHKFLISVDGGINAETAVLCREAGADVLVSGSWLFGAANRAERIARLRGPGPADA
jgi:ribulose-phosphate 3-epimerase